MFFMHELPTPREERAFTARPKIQSQSQIFRYGGSIFCMPHLPNFSDIFDLLLHWVSVVREFRYVQLYVLYSVRKRMKLLEVVNFFITAILFSLFTYEFIIVIRKFHRDSFQFINENKFEELMPPTITFCPAPAYKKPGPFLSEKEFIENKFTLEELFHPLVLEKLKNESLFEVKETYAAYYGLCYTIQKLTAEKISDYSFQFVLNNTIGEMNFYFFMENIENEREDCRNQRT